jgi:hypothetical protein
MLSILIETVVMAFVMGGIMGAVTALHLSSEQKGQPARVLRRTNPRRRPNH